MPTLIALAGGSRSGKGTAASVLRRKATEDGFSVAERQLSGPGKQYVASAFRPDITEDEAIAWFEELKPLDTWIEVSALKSPGVEDRRVEADISLQAYLQNMLQGARERWGDDFWTDKLLPTGRVGPHNEEELWWASFGVPWDGRTNVADLALISDLRQDNEANRVHLVGGDTAAVFECFRPDHDDSYVTSKEHITERGLSPGKADFVMHSNGDIDYWVEIWEAAYEDHIRPRIENLKET